MGFSFGKSIVTDSLIYAIDTANSNSYVSGSTALNDQTANQNNGTSVIAHPCGPSSGWVPAYNGQSSWSSNNGNYFLDATNAPNGPHWQVGDVFSWNGSNYFIVQVHSSTMRTGTPLSVTSVSPSEGYCCACAQTCDGIGNCQYMFSYWPALGSPMQQLWIDWHAQNNQWSSAGAVDPYAAAYSGPGGVCYSYGGHGSCTSPQPCCSDSSATNFDPNCPYQMHDVTLCTYFNTNPVQGTDINIPGGPTGIGAFMNPIWNTFIKKTRLFPSPRSMLTFNSILMFFLLPFQHSISYGAIF